MRVLPAPDAGCGNQCTSLKLGATRQLIARVTTAAGEELPGAQVTWTSSTPARATVSGTGVVTALSAGTTVIRAEVGALHGDFAVTVQEQAVARVEVTPAALTLEAGEPQVLSARALDADGQEIPNITFTWMASNPRVVAVDAYGTATGLVTGSAMVLAFPSRGFVAGAAAAAVSAAPQPPGMSLASVSTGTFGGCGLDGEGAAYCWGSNTGGQMGNGTQGGLGEAFPFPEPVVGGHLFGQLDMGADHACAIDVNNDAWCWGANGVGELGISDIARDPPGTVVPTAVFGGYKFRHVSVGDLHTCGETLEGQGLCWGFGPEGTGGGQTWNVLTPQPVLGTHTWQSISAGLTSTCGLDTDGKAWCWGSNEQGQLGDGTFDSRNKNQPQPVLTDLTFKALDLESSHVCALTVDGAAWCWGRNETGQLGDGDLADGVWENKARPVAVETELRFETIATGGHHTCALTADGRAWCWGNNGYGNLGDGTDILRDRPVAVMTELRFASVDAANNHTCGVTLEGRAYCWGSAWIGELGGGFGGGDGLFSTAPWPVSQPLTPLR